MLNLLGNISNNNDRKYKFSYIKDNLSSMFEKFNAVKFGEGKKKEFQQ